MIIRIWREPSAHTDLPALLHAAEVKEDGTLGEVKPFNPRGSRRFWGYGVQDLELYADGDHIIPCPKPESPRGRTRFDLPSGTLKRHLTGREYAEFMAPYWLLRDLVEFSPDDGSLPDLGADPVVRLGVHPHQQDSLQFSLVSGIGYVSRRGVARDDERRNSVSYNSDGGPLPVVKGKGTYLKAIEARLADPSLTDAERSELRETPVLVVLFLDDADLAPFGAAKAQDVRLDGPDAEFHRPHVTRSYPPAKRLLNSAAPFKVDTEPKKPGLSPSNYWGAGRDRSRRCVGASPIAPSATILRAASPARSTVRNRGSPFPD